MSAVTSIDGEFARLVVTTPVRVVSEMNHREHPMKRAGRARDQKLITLAALRTTFGMVPPKPPLVVTMTRLIGKGGRRMDSDNVVSACKHVRDAIAAWLGIDDRHDHLVRYDVAQEKSASKWPGVRIEIARRG